MLWTWTNTHNSKVCIEQYNLDRDGWRHTAAYEANAINSNYLWLHVAEGGMVCTLSVMDENLPIIFSAFAASTDLVGMNLHTEIDRQLLLKSNGTFDKENILFANWKNRSCLLVIPNVEIFSLGLLRIKNNGVWLWWDVLINHQTPASLKAFSIRAACQLENRILAMPACGGVLFEIDLNDDTPAPHMAASLPILPREISSMCAMLTDKGKHQVLAKSNNTILHLMEPNIWRIVAPWLGPVSIFLFVGPHSAALCIEDSRTYAVCSLTTGDVVRRFQFDHIPSFVSIRAKGTELWSVDTEMRVHRQDAAFRRSSNFIHRSAASEHGDAP